ncbi:MAG TPA: NAD(P)/FAD-dependent oxidoreductase, partial [Tahibacter sp.]|nr:NAD(P)/FAD-dependent oxidoreductase [Tahibacter sp.]
SMSLKHSAPPAPRAGRGLVIASLAAASLAARPAAAQTDYYNTDAGRPITIEDAYPVERRAVEIQLAPLRLERARGIDEAISTAGGVRFEAMNEHLMLSALPGVFCAGEMIDWEAPTGGYLLTASFASGRVAGFGAVEWLRAQT